MFFGRSYWGRENVEGACSRVLFVGPCPSVGSHSRLSLELRCWRIGGRLRSGEMRRMSRGDLPFFGFHFRYGQYLVVTESQYLLHRLAVDNPRISPTFCRGFLGVIGILTSKNINLPINCTSLNQKTTFPSPSPQSCPDFGQIDCSG